MCGLEDTEGLMLRDLPKSVAVRLGLPALILLVCFQVATTSAAAQEDASAPAGAGTERASAEDYPLRSGDAIRLEFWREAEMNGEYRVDEQGATVLPILGRRQVTGAAAQVVKRRLQEEYARHIRDEAFQITLLRRVTIFGAVNDPGLYYVDATMTVADAVALAGGSRREGELTGVKILRDGQEIRSQIDSSEPVLSTVRSGDQVFVPERSWLSRNVGVVVGASVSVVGLLLSQVF